MLKGGEKKKKRCEQINCKPRNYENAFPPTVRKKKKKKKKVFKGQTCDQCVEGVQIFMWDVSNV